MKARQQESQREFHGNQHKEVCVRNQNHTTEPKTSTDKELAEIAGVSKYTIQGTRKILAEGTEEQKQRARKCGKSNTINSILKEIEDVFIRVIRVINFYRCKHTCI